MQSIRVSAAGLVALVAVLGVLAVAPLASAATLTTDKADYFPGEVATITGSLFEAMQNVLLYIVGQSEDGTMLTSHEWGVQANEVGGFVTTYTLPNFYVPLYLLAASADGEVLAETTFTDSRNWVLTFAGTGSGSVTVTPSSGTVTAPVSCGGTGAAAASQTVTGTCSPNISTSDNGATVTFSASAEVGSTFAGWSSPANLSGSTCSGTTSPCSAVLGANAALTVSFNLNKTNPTLSISNSPQTYTGSPIAATIVANGGAVAGTVSDAKYDGSLTVPTNAGTYAMTADFAPTDTVNYNPLNDAPAGNFVISKIAPIASVTNTPQPYTGSEQTATVACLGGGAATLASGGVGTNAGSYPATINCAESTNYNAATGLAAGNFVIQQASSDTVITCPVSAVYTSAAIEPCTAAVTGAGLNTTATVTYGNNVNVGTATANASYAGDINHTGSTATQKTFEITAADANCTISGFTGPYDGNLHGATGSCIGVGSDGTLTGLSLGASYTDVPGGTANWSFSNPNYEPENGSVGIVINPVDAVCVVDDYDGDYDALPHGVTTGSCTGVEDENLDGLVIDSTTYTNVPGGLVNWTFTDVTGNYNNDSGVANVTIAKVDAVCTVTGYDVTYDGAPHTATGSCLGVEGETLAGLDLTGTTHTATGNYPTDPWTFTDVTGNYNGDSGTVADNIDKATQAITFPDPGNKIFGATFASNATADSGLTVSLASENENCSIDGLSINVDGPQGSSCTITASQAGDTNYLPAVSVQHTFLILPYGVPTTFPPITLTKKEFQKGSTIPVKFKIASTIDGSPVTWAIAQLYIAAGDKTATPTDIATPAVSSGGSNAAEYFRSGEQYVFNLSTKMPELVKGLATLKIVLDDGSVILQLIKIK